MSEKILKGKAYGSIPHLLDSRLGEGDHHCHEGQHNICTKEVRDYNDIVIVQEKLDGSCVSIYKPSHCDLKFITRSGYETRTSLYQQHHIFNDWGLKPDNYTRFQGLLQVGERAVGEWLYQVHSTRYTLHHEPFVLFDIMKGGVRMPYLELLKRAYKYGFTTPKLVNYGQSISTKQVMKLLKTSGHGAIDPVEGAVWRVERNGKVDFLCKYVRCDKIDGLYMKEEIWNDSVDKKEITNET